MPAVAGNHPGQQPGTTQARHVTGQGQLPSAHKGPNFVSVTTASGKEQMERDVAQTLVIVSDLRQSASNLPPSDETGMHASHSGPRRAEARLSRPVRCLRRISRSSPACTRRCLGLDDRGPSAWAARRPAGVSCMSELTTTMKRGRIMSTVRLTTNFGDIDLALDEAKAPKTVENFLNYVRSGHYDGTIFHRVISGFMIQGGGFDAQMGQKPTGASVQNEADNGLLNAAYTVAMARTNDPQSATAQFFINLTDNDFLNFKEKTVQGWGYTVFGKVIGGLDTVDQISRVKPAVAAAWKTSPPRRY